MSVFGPLLISILLPTLNPEAPAQCRADAALGAAPEATLQLESPQWEVARAVKAWLAQDATPSTHQPQADGWLVLPLPMEPGAVAAAVVVPEPAVKKGLLIGAGVGAGLIALSWWLAFSVEASCQAPEAELPKYPEVASLPADPVCLWCGSVELEPLALRDVETSRMYDRSVDPSQVQPRTFASGFAALREESEPQGRYAVRRGATAEAAGASTGLGVATPSLGGSGQLRSKVAR